MKRNFQRYLVLGVILIFLVSSVFISGCNQKEKKNSLILATTTSVYDSGLLDLILPDFEEENNCNVKVIAVGTGEAIKMGEKGDSDNLIVHSPKDEEKFMNEGYGLKRDTFMYNYFLIVGPKSDPADVKDKKSLKDALLKVAQNGKFLSRGDDSGTNKKELKLWSEVGVKPEGKNYIESGQGMGDTLAIANDTDAYTLTDAATYASLKKNLGNLEIYFEDGDELLNQYSVITINNKENKRANKEMAEKFYNWIISKKTKKKIESFKGGGLFFIY